MILKYVSITIINTKNKKKIQNKIIYYISINHQHKLNKFFIFNQISSTKALELCFDS